MAESIGRFTRITAEEAQQRLTAVRPAKALSEQFATFFATLEPCAYYELVLQRQEKGAIIRERILRFVEENAIAGVHVRAGRKYDKNTVILWRESGSQTRQEPWAQEPPADISPGAEAGDETNQPAEPGKEGDTLAPPPLAAGQSIMASDTTPQEELEERLEH